MAIEWVWALAAVPAFMIRWRRRKPPRSLRTDILWARTGMHALVISWKRRRTRRSLRTDILWARTGMRAYVLDWKRRHAMRSSGADLGVYLVTTLLLHPAFYLVWTVRYIRTKVPR